MHVVRTARAEGYETQAQQEREDSTFTASRACQRSLGPLTVAAIMMMTRSGKIVRLSRTKTSQPKRRWRWPHAAVQPVTGTMTLPVKHTVIGTGTLLVPAIRV